MTVIEIFLFEQARIMESNFTKIFLNENNQLTGQDDFAM